MSVDGAQPARDERMTDTVRDVAQVKLSLGVWRWGSKVTLKAPAFLVFLSSQIQETQIASW